MNPFDDEAKIYITFEIRGHGKLTRFKAEYDDDVHWAEVLDDVIGRLEATWGYAFNVPLETPGGMAGIYHEGKKREAE